MGKKFRTHVQGESLQKKIDADYEQYFCIWGFFLLSWAVCSPGCMQKAGRFWFRWLLIC